MYTVLSIYYLPITLTSIVSQFPWRLLSPITLASIVSPLPWRLLVPHYLGIYCFPITLASIVPPETCSLQRAPAPPST